jgi:hypothetical protein
MRHLLGIFLLLLATTSHAELVVVAGKDSLIEKMDKRQVADIFLAKTTRLIGGSRVQPIELLNNDAKATFYFEISGKTIAQVNSYWTTLIFTGKGKPPKNVKEIGRLTEILNSDPYAITYLPLNQITESMKILHVFQ